MSSRGGARSSTKAAKQRASKYDKLSYEAWYAQLRSAADEASRRAEARGLNPIHAIGLDARVRELRSAYPRYANQERKNTTANLVTTQRSARNSAARPAAESIHERSARLQREGNLSREVRPGERIEYAPLGHTVDPFVTGRAAVERTLASVGERQLGAALTRDYSLDSLRDALRDYGLRGGRTKAETISRITAHVTGGRYSANFGAPVGGKSSGGGSRDSDGGSRGGRRGGTPRTAADHEARIAALRSQLAQAEQEYAAFQRQHGG